MAWPPGALGAGYYLRLVAPFESTDDAFIDVLDAERTEYQTQDNLVQSDQAVAQDLIALCKALGGGWPAPGPDQR